MEGGKVIGPFDQDDFLTMGAIKQDIEFMQKRLDLDYHAALEKDKALLKDKYFSRTLQ